jgi:glucuronate isomerase
MKAFMDEDFMLQNETGKKLYHEYASKMPIFDFHNHLSAKEIYEDFTYENIAQAWLTYDHYKWRAMRTYGINECLVTGKDNDYERYLAFVETIENAIGNPLYHWTHLELQRYFGINQTLKMETAKDIWDTCNAKLHTKAYSIRNLLSMQNVSALCTTDDPIDDLRYHFALREEGFAIKVLPTFRPDRAINIEKEDFVQYIKLVEECVGSEIHSVEDLMSALTMRLEHFIQAGCLVTDHSLEGNIWSKSSKSEVDAILRKKLIGEEVSEEEASRYRGYLLSELGKEYAKRGLVMQLHIGALRDNSNRLRDRLGVNIGCDGMHDMNYAPEISGLLDSMDSSNEMPKVILYCLNPKDNEMLACMAGNFQGETRGKVQFGTAWWFNDHRKGMEEQMEVLASQGLISTFIGMLTDSRSYLSFPRHEYFRRILCNKIGKWVEEGEYPCDMTYLGKLVQDISFTNAKEYFSLS